MPVESGISAVIQAPPLDVGPLQQFIQMQAQAKQMEMQNAQSQLQLGEKVSQFDAERGAEIIGGAFKTISKQTGQNAFQHYAQSIHDTWQQQQQQQTQEFNQWMAQSKQAQTTAGLQARYTTSQLQEQDYLNGLVQTMQNPLTSDADRTRAAHMYAFIKSPTADNALFVGANPEELRSLVTHLREKAEGIMSPAEKDTKASDLATKTANDNFGGDINKATQYWRAWLNHEKIPDELQPKATSQAIADQQMNRFALLISHGIPFDSAYSASLTGNLADVPGLDKMKDPAVEEAQARSKYMNTQADAERSRKELYDAQAAALNKKGALVTPQDLEAAGRAVVDLSTAVKNNLIDKNDPSVAQAKQLFNDLVQRYRMQGVDQQAFPGKPGPGGPGPGTPGTPAAGAGGAGTSDLLPPGTLQNFPREAVKSTNELTGAGAFLGLPPWAAAPVAAATGIKAAAGAFRNLPPWLQTGSPVGALQAGMQGVNALQQYLGNLAYPPTAPTPAAATSPTPAQVQQMIKQQAPAAQQQAPAAQPAPGGPTDQFDQPIPPDRQQEYEQWKAKLPADQQSTADYDLQGAFLAGIKPDPKTGHLDDTYKKPNHPTFSTDSVYSGDKSGEVGGRWVKVGDKWRFFASPDNLKHYSVDELRDYFRRHEPDSTLILPDGSIAYRPEPK